MSHTQDALPAPSRGILHNSGLLILLLVAYYYKPRSSVVLLCVAISSHQVLYDILLYCSLYSSLMLSLILTIAIRICNLELYEPILLYCLLLMYNINNSYLLS